jgi:hypothetical protein
VINNVSTRLVSKDSIIDDDYINDSGTLGMPAKQTYWQAQVKSLLKAKLKRRDLSYVDLAEKLAGVGVILIFYSWRRFAVRKLLILLVWGADFSEV